MIHQSRFMFTKIMAAKHGSDCIRDKRWPALKTTYDTFHIFVPIYLFLFLFNHIINLSHLLHPCLLSLSLKIHTSFFSFKNMRINDYSLSYILKLITTFFLSIVWYIYILFLLRFEPQTLHIIIHCTYQLS